MGRHVPLAGRTVVVTGAGSGIGRAVAQRVARDGCPVAIVDWDEEGLRATEDSIDGPVLAQKLDVRDRQGQLAWAATVREWAPAPIGLVLNNAGVTVAQTVADGSPEDDEWVHDVNFWGVVHGTRAWLPVLVEQGSGTIANVSSLFGIIAFPNQSMYCATKFAVRGYTEALKHELRGTGVRAVAIHPGGIKTNIVRNARFHADDLGGTDHGKFMRDFDKMARTSPEKAAATIQRGVEAQAGRILVGPDAKGLSLVARIAPVRYFDVVDRLGKLARPG